MNFICYKSVSKQSNEYLLVVPIVQLLFLLVAHITWSFPRCASLITATFTSNSSADWTRRSCAASLWLKFILLFSSTLPLSQRPVSTCLQGLSQYKKPAVRQNWIYRTCLGKIWQRKHLDPFPSTFYRQLILILLPDEYCLRIAVCFPDIFD